MLKNDQFLNVHCSFLHLMFIVQCFIQCSLFNASFNIVSSIFASNSLLNVQYSQSTFKADPPNPEKIPDADLVGVTVVLLTCSYR